MPESELATALRLYTEAQTDVLRQKRILDELQRDGHPALGARTLLQLLENTLAERQKILERVSVQQP